MTAPLVVRKFVKKSLPVEMVQLTEANGEAVAKWVGKDATFFPGGVLELSGKTRPPSIQVKTPEGILTAPVGFWIVRGVNGEFYPISNCVKDVSYDPLCEHCGTAHRDCDPCL